jgi:transcriptional/translational regulatory protein YebC/TACO1
MELVLEAGADDVNAADDHWEITCEPSVMTGVIDTIKAAGLELASNELVRIPTNTVDVEDVETARKVLNLMERLDDHDDVQSVAANFSIPDAALAELA